MSESDATPEKIIASDQKHSQEQRKPKKMTRRAFGTALALGVFSTAVGLRSGRIDVDDLHDLKQLYWYLEEYLKPLETVSPEDKKQFKNFLHAQKDTLKKDGRGLLHATTYQLGPSMTANVHIASNAIEQTLLEKGKTYSFNELSGITHPENYPLYKDNRLGPNIANSWALGVCLTSTIIGRSLLLHPDVSIREAHAHHIPVGRLSQQHTYAPHYQEELQNIDFAVAYNPGGKSYDFVFDYHGESKDMIKIEMFDTAGNKLEPDAAEEGWDHKSSLSIMMEERSPILVACSASLDAVARSDRVKLVQTDDGFQRYLDGKLDFQMNRT